MTFRVKMVLSGVVFIAGFALFVANDASIARAKGRLEEDLRRHEQYAAQARAALQRS